MTTNSPDQCSMRQRPYISLQLQRDQRGSVCAMCALHEFNAAVYDGQRQGKPSNTPTSTSSLGGLGIHQSLSLISAINAS
jgi:hypothetical protein